MYKSICRKRRPIRYHRSKKQQYRKYTSSVLRLTSQGTEDNRNNINEVAPGPVFENVGEHKIRFECYNDDYFEFIGFAPEERSRVVKLDNDSMIYVGIVDQIGLPDGKGKMINKKDGRIYEGSFDHGNKVYGKMYDPKSKSYYVGMFLVFCGFNLIGDMLRLVVFI